MTALLQKEDAAHGAAPKRRPAFKWHHLVTLEETNLVGNVYFARHVAWQGSCRETFLHHHAPGVLDALTEGLSLVTLRCGCEYFDELRAFDPIILELRLAHLVQHRVGLDFDYYRLEGSAERLIARGHQEIGCMTRAGGALRPVPPPEELVEALRPFGGHQA